MKYHNMRFIYNMPYTIQTRLNVSKELASLKALREIIGRKGVLDEIGAYAVDRLNYYSPESIRGGWIFEVNGNSLTVRHNRVEDKVLWWLEYGTKAHRVEPVNANVLHWVENGIDYFSKGHDVSGIAPGLFFAHASDDVEEYIKKKYSAIGFKRIQVTV